MHDNKLNVVAFYAGRVFRPDSVANNSTKDNNSKEFNVLAIDSAADSARIRSEAKAIEAHYGKNPYSDYLFRYGKRPSVNEAATIGRLLGGRVAASDGSLQPPLTKVDRKVLAAIKARRREASRRYDHILRLRDAIAALSQNEDDPADVIACGSVLLECPEISRQLDLALCCLNRFATEWHSREEATRARDAECASSAKNQDGSEGELCVNLGDDG